MLLSEIWEHSFNNPCGVDLRWRNIKRDKTLVLSDCAAPTPAQQGPGGAGVTAVSSLVPRFVLKSHTNVIKSTRDVWKENKYSRGINYLGFCFCLRQKWTCLACQCTYNFQEVSSNLFPHCCNVKIIIANCVDNWTDVMDSTWFQFQNHADKDAGWGPYMTCDIWINSGSGSDKNTTTPNAASLITSAASHSQIFITWHFHLLYLDFYDLEQVHYCILIFGTLHFNFSTRGLAELTNTALQYFF